MEIVKMFVNFSKCSLAAYSKFTTYKLSVTCSHCLAKVL